MAYWQAILLGIIQGLTEFLPVSSSGHLIIFKELLGISSDGFLDFTLAVHFATVCSTIVVFRREILSLLKAFFSLRYDEKTAYIIKLIISMIPIGLIGFFLKDYVEQLFGEGLIIVSASLLITAFLLSLSYFVTCKNKQVEADGEYTDISYLQSIIVGVAQCFAILPGLSRSGTTIAIGLISGVKKNIIAQFSFLMVLAPIIGEQVLNLMKNTNSISNIEVLPFCLGFISAFLSGLFACKLMISLVKKAKLYYFSIYCIIVAIILFLF